MDTCKLYNLIDEPEDISNEGGLVGPGTLTAKYFDVIAGVPTVTLTDLIGAHILFLFRENAPFEEVEAFTTGRQFLFDDETGEIEFPTNLNQDEKLLAFYYTGSAPTSFTEPVTVAEMKDYLRLMGFADADGSTSDFDTDDTLISNMITAARRYFEKKLEISIVSKKLRVSVTNLAGGQKITHGPVLAITSFENCNGDTITDYILRGGKWPNIKSPCAEEMTIEYLAGYMATPWSDDVELLRLAIKQLVAWNYVHRGDENGVPVCKEALKTAAPFNRKSILV